MDNSKQKLLIEYLISSKDVFAICQAIIEPGYFVPEFRNAVTFIKKYYTTYNTTPEPAQIKAETGVELVQRDIQRDQIEYTTAEIEKFCKESAFESAILSAPKLKQEGKMEEVQTRVRDALMISLNRNLGLRYFDDPNQRLQRMLHEDPVHTTGWKEVDDLIGGGIARRELLLLSANSGGGKSITLANLTYNFLHEKQNALYITLELAEDIVAQRFDAMFTGVTRQEWQSRISEITTQLRIEKENCGILDIVQMRSGTRPREIQAYLKEYYLHHGIMPDLLVVDYLDKMYPNEKIDLGDVWTKDKLVSEQLRDIGVEHNMFVATASQLNRDAVKAAHHDHSHIAGGISKINESDIYISIRMTPEMMAAGQCTFTLQKTRNSAGVGKSIYLKWIGKRLRIVDDNEPTPTLQFKKKTDNPIESSSTGGERLLDLMSSL